MTGLEMPLPGNAVFQATFDSAVHFRGTPVSRLTPLRFGPRHPGQFSAPTSPTPTVNTITARKYPRCLIHVPFIESPP